MHLLGLSCPEISQKLTSALLAFLQAPVSVEFSQAFRVESGPYMQAISVLWDQILEVPCLFKGDKGHVGEWGDGLGHLDHVLIGLVADLLSLFLPGPWPSFEDSIDTRAKVRNATCGADASSGEGDEVFALENEVGEFVNFLLEDIFRVEELLLLFFGFVSSVGHKCWFFIKQQELIQFKVDICWFRLEKMKQKVFYWYFLIRVDKGVYLRGIIVSSQGFGELMFLNYIAERVPLVELVGRAYLLQLIKFSQVEALVAIGEDVFSHLHVFENISDGLGVVKQWNSFFNGLVRVVLLSFNTSIYVVQLCEFLPLQVGVVSRYLCYYFGKSFFYLGLEFNQNQTTFRFQFSLLVVHQIRGEPWFHFGDCEWVALDRVVDIVIDWAKNFNGLDGLWLHFDGDILDTGEEGVVELIHEVGLQILLLNCAHVVESSHLYQLLAGLWSKICWNSYYCGWYSSIGYLPDQILLSGHWVVTDISQHHYPMLIIFHCVILSEILYVFLCFLKSWGHCGPSALKFGVYQSLYSFLFEIFYKGTLNDGPWLIVENNKGKYILIL